MQYQFTWARGFYFAGIAACVAFLLGLLLQTGRDLENWLVMAGLNAYYAAHVGFIIGFCTFRLPPADNVEIPIPASNATWKHIACRLLVGLILGVYVGALFVLLMLADIEQVYGGWGGYLSAPNEQDWIHVRICTTCGTAMSVTTATILAVLLAPTYYDTRSVFQSAVFAGGFGLLAGALVTWAPGFLAPARLSESQAVVVATILGALAGGGVTVFLRLCVRW